ncbi:hypothetical protein, partial [Desulfatitalea alkaliphila]
ADTEKTMGVREDISRLPNLKNVGLALIDYVESLQPGITFSKKGKRWVPSENFVTFTIQFVRSKKIVISLRGNPDEFLEFEDLPLKEGMGYGAYSECHLESPKQLPAISMHIKNAYDIYCKGVLRRKKHPTIVEE